MHWLFRAGSAHADCVGIQVLPDGDYVVIDSPTGTYMAGHRDKGHWRREYDYYVAQGYVPEAEAKAAGLIPESWSREPPALPWERKPSPRRAIALTATVAAVMLLGAVLFRLLLRVMMSSLR